MVKFGHCILANEQELDSFDKRVSLLLEVSSS